MDDTYHFLVGQLWNIFRDFIIFFLIIYVGEWIADKNAFRRFERAWLITLMCISLLIFVLWSRLGFILIWT
jgi:hypothetical protein